MSASHSPDALTRRPLPWHLPVVGILVLIWDAFGVFDFVMTFFRVESYLAQFTPEQRAFFERFPPLFTGLWAVSVFGGVAGSLLLLLRRRVAAGILAVAFGTSLVTMVWMLAMGSARVMGQVGLIFTVVILAVAGLVAVYAWAMVRRGVLR